MYIPPCWEILVHYILFFFKANFVPGLKRPSLFWSYRFFMSPLKHISLFFLLPLHSLFLVPTSNQIANCQINFIRRIILRLWKKFTCDCLPSRENGVCEPVLYMWVYMCWVSDEMMTLVTGVYANQFYTHMYPPSCTQWVCAKGRFCIWEMNQS